MRRLTHVCAALLLAALSAWGGAPKTLALVCDDGLRATVRHEKEGLWLFLPHQTVLLPFIDARRGPRTYLGEGVRLRLEGEEATLWWRGEHRCRYDRKAAIWEDAKLRGVDFRAVGQEPPWILELSGQSATFYLGYDRRTYRFGRLRVVSNQKPPETRIEGESGGHRLRVTLTPGPCMDAMSGEPFETRVEIVFDGRKLSGCGRALH
ncbi:COG3650 family protein [Hydrogenimonas sp.]